MYCITDQEGMSGEMPYRRICPGEMSGYRLYMCMHECVYITSRLLSCSSIRPSLLGKRRYCHTHKNKDTFWTNRQTHKQENTHTCIRGLEGHRKQSDIRKDRQTNRNTQTEIEGRTTVKETDKQRSYLSCRTVPETLGSADDKGILSPANRPIKAKSE